MAESHFLVAVAAIVVAGCVSGPVGERATPLELPPAFASRPADVGSLELCHRLAPDAASEWLDQVSERNFDLQGGLARLRQAEAVAGAAAAPLWPRLDAQLEASRANTPFVAGAFLPRSGVSTTWQGSLAAGYELDVWARLRNERSAAELDADAARHSLHTLALTLRAQALDSWYGAVAQRQLLELLDEQTELSERFLELTRLRFGLGQVPAQDVGRQKQQLLSLDGQRVLAAAQAELLDSRLAALAGEVPGTLRVAAATLPPVPPIPDPGLPANILQRRPDVHAAQAALAAADRRVAAAVAQRLPALRIDASLLSIEQSLSEVFADVFWSLGATLAGNVFDRGAQRARIGLASAQADEALYAYANSLLRALSEVHEALIRNAGQDEFLRSLLAQHAEAQKVLLLTRDAYRQGQVSYLEVLNALSSLQGLERQMLDARRQQFSNRLDLCRAAGVMPGARIPS